MTPRSATPAPKVAPAAGQGSAQRSPTERDRSPPNARGPAAEPMPTVPHQDRFQR